MNQPSIRPYVSNYTGTIYHKTNLDFKQTFKCQEELLDFRYQLSCMDSNTSGYYVVFDFDDNKDKHYAIKSNGEMNDHPEYDDVKLLIAINLAKLSRSITESEYIKYY